MSAPDPDSDIARRLIGAWRYAGSTSRRRARAPIAANPRGIIIYDPSGHMAVQIVPGPGAAGERAGLAVHLPISAPIRIDERAGTVTHHREGDLRSDAEIDAVRQYEFVGDRLILRPVGKTQEIMWERIK